MAILDLILGPMLVGTCLSIFFGGILTTQCYTYYIRFPNDPLWLRCMVLYFFLTDLFHSGVELAIVYDYTITLFGDFQKVGSASVLFAFIPVTSVCISSVAQTFFAWRVARLTRLRFLGYLITFLAIVQFLCGIGVTIGVTIVKQFTEFQKFQGVVIPWLVSSAVCDLIITVALVWYLGNNRSGIPATDDLVTRLIRSTVQTGALTTFWALLDLVIYLTESNSLHLLFNFPLAKIYTNSLLSTLNARRSTAERLHISGLGEGLPSDTDAKDLEMSGSGGGKAGRVFGSRSGATASIPRWEKGSKARYTHSQVTHDIPLPPRAFSPSRSPSDSDLTGNKSPHAFNMDMEDDMAVEVKANEISELDMH